MASFTKVARRAVKRVTLAWRQKTVDRAPPWARRMFGPALLNVDMLLVDHGIFRVVYPNRHKLGAQAWRAAQPTPGQLKRWAKQGLKTVVNLRGERLCGSYYLERSACREAGLSLVNYQMRSRAAPSRAEVLGARDVLNSIAYPALIHCKSGADRAGLMSVLYRHVREGWPIEKALGELSLKYGHIRQANTGVLDHFFEVYIAANRRRPIDFFEWVETEYDPDEVRRSFQSRGWANRLVDGVLRRE